MRTTVNISDDLLAEAKIVAARRARPLSDIVNDALRRMLAEQEHSPRADFHWRDVGIAVPGDKGLQHGVNWRSNSAILELIEDL